VPQIDNAAYAVGLSERVRTRVEQFGRVQLRDTEAAALVQSKAVHVVLLVAAVPTAVWLGSHTFGFLPAFVAFWLGGVAEAIGTPDVGTTEKIKGAGKATGAAVLGLVGSLSMVTVAFFV
jgi:hypothetical protein